MLENGIQYKEGGGECGWISHRRKIVLCVMGTREGFKQLATFVFGLEKTIRIWIKINQREKTASWAQ